MEKVIRSSFDTAYRIFPLVGARYIVPILAYHADLGISCRSWHIMPILAHRAPTSPTQTCFPVSPSFVGADGVRPL
jgi:hypothetical protein